MTDYELAYCYNCIQMTNGKGIKCFKCGMYGRKEVRLRVSNSEQKKKIERLKKELEVSNSLINDIRNEQFELGKKATLQRVKEALLICWDKGIISEYDRENIENELGLDEEHVPFHCDKCGSGHDNAIVAETCCPDEERAK